MPPNGKYAGYKQDIRNYLYNKFGWDRHVATKWLNDHEQFVRQMMATGARYQETAKAINDMEQRVNAEQQ